jgi:hypothetical protein
MSYIRRIPPSEPEPDFQRIVLEELDNIWSVLRILSSRLARLEAEKPSRTACRDSGTSV